MKKFFTIMALFLTIFMTSCMNVREVSKIVSSNDIIVEDVEEILIRKIPPEPKIVSEENKDKPVGANSVGLPVIQTTPSYSEKAVVLTYHHISNNPFSGITITPERFEEDLKMLRDNNFNVISLRDMICGIEGNVELPENAAVITFDDGIGSFYKYAYPLLMKYNMPAVEFIITARNESYVSSDNDLNPLSPEEINEMFKSGLVDIQSHTHNSHDYIYRNAELKKGPKLTYKIYNTETSTLESDEEYISRITDDLATSREIIYKYTGVYPDMLSFPFGSYNKKVWDVGKAVGFNYFITTHPDYNKENSKSQTIYRIRSGDAVLTSDKLLKNIIDCVNNVKKN
ncbi:MAG: polysaccharide deacetylase [Clostridiales bacterium]|nr:polysaccharide deacetylase [Clostridiales bacterium]